MVLIRSYSRVISVFVWLELVIWWWMLVVDAKLTVCVIYLWAYTETETIVRPNSIHLFLCVTLYSVLRSILCSALFCVPLMHALILYLHSVIVHEPLYTDTVSIDSSVPSWRYQCELSIYEYTPCKMGRFVAIIHHYPLYYYITLLFQKVSSLCY